MRDRRQRSLRRQFLHATRRPREPKIDFLKGGIQALYRIRIPFPPRSGVPFRSRVRETAFLGEPGLPIPREFPAGGSEDAARAWCARRVARLWEVRSPAQPRRIDRQVGSYDVVLNSRFAFSPRHLRPMAEALPACIV